MPQQLRAVLFDKDGTLVSFHATWTRAYEQAAGDVASLCGGQIDAAQLLTAGGLDPTTGRYDARSVLACGNAADIARVWQSHLPGSTDAGGECLSLDRVEAAIESAFQVSVGWTPVAVEGLCSALRALHARGLSLGVATMDSQAMAAMHLEALRISDYFSFVCGYDSGHGVKPDPGMLQAFCNATGHAPGAVVMVGDTPHDLEMGRRAGAGLLVGVLTGTGERTDLLPLADVVLPSLAALPAHLAQLD
jgi:phosphoglycolate phosphatase